MVIGLNHLRDEMSGREEYELLMFRNFREVVVQQLLRIQELSGSINDVFNPGQHSYIMWSPNCTFNID